MKINKKVPIEREFNGTNKLLLSPINNKLVFYLYTKKSRFSSHKCLFAVLSSLFGGNYGKKSHD